MIKSTFFIILTTLLTISCEKSFDNKQDLTNYIKDEDNEYKYSKLVNGVTFELQYKPTELLIAQEMDNISDHLQYTKLKNKYDKNIYFNLSLSMNDGEILATAANDSGKYIEMVDQLVFKMDKEVSFSNSNRDTLDMIDFVYPRMYGMSKATTVMIIYPRNEEFLNSDYLNFSLNDLGLGTGDITFKVNPEVILRTHKIKAYN